MYKCPGCGAALRFDPKSQKMHCDHCQTELDPRDSTLTQTVESFGQENVIPQEGMYQSMVYTCPNCGGTILSTDETAATFCSYCGASVLLNGRLEQMERPDVIIPFRMDKEDCKESYKKLLNRAVFMPTYMKKESEIDKFRGIYMPYWIYSFVADGDTQGNGETSHRSGDYIITEHYRVNRFIHSSYDGLSYDAASNFADVMSEAISPFRTAGAEPFTDTYLSGFYADVSDVDKEVYEGDAADIAKDYMADSTVDHADYRRCGVKTSDVANSIPLESLPKRKGYFPVWFLATQIPGRQQVSYAVMNGETGKIAADLPVAFWKYILAALGLAVPIFLILQFFFTPTPKVALIATIVISLIMLIVLNAQFNRSYERQYGIDRGMQNKLSKAPSAEGEKTEESLEAEKEKVKQEEKKSSAKGCLMALFWVAIGIAAFLAYGLLSRYNGELAMWVMIGGGVAAFIIVSIVSTVKSSKRKTDTKAPMRKKIGYLIKPIIGIVLAVVILILNPVYDLYYYGAAALAELLIVWCAFDAVALHNKGTTRPLPQFNKRGGAGK